jgi:hypothetical protein
MNPSPSDCPDPARLRRVLDEALSESEGRDLAAHLETCASRRAQLDRWTEDPAVLAGAPGPDKAAVATSPALDEVLQRLGREPERGDSDVSRTEPPEASGATQECPPGRSEAITTPEADLVALDFLAPTD